MIAIAAPPVKPERWLSSRRGRERSHREQLPPVVTPAMVAQLRALCDALRPEDSTRLAGWWYPTTAEAIAVELFAAGIRDAVTVDPDTLVVDWRSVALIAQAQRLGVPR